MRYLLVLILFFSGSVAAQKYQQYDTIAEPAIAIEKLHTALVADEANPELYNRLAQRKIQIEEYDSCIYYANKSIELLTKSENKKLLIRALHHKGTAQYFLDDKAKADSNWRQALQLAVQENDYDEITSIAPGLGAIYLDKGYLKNNEPIFNTADSFFAIGYTQIIAKDSLVTLQGQRTLRLMATSLHFQKKYDSASIYYKKVIESSRGRFTIPYLGALSFYAEVLSITGKHKEAIATIKEAADFAAHNEVNSKSKTHIIHVYAEVLSASGNYKDAYAMMDSSYKLLATDYEKVNAQSYAVSESKFKNQLLQYQVALEKQKKNRLYYLIAGFVLLTSLGALWLINRNNKRIAKEKARQKQISIDAFIEGEEKEKIRIGRELHDGIAQEIVGIKLAMQQKKADPALVNELTRISLDIRNISHELMPQTLKDYGLEVAIEDVCQKILAPSGIHYEISSTLPEERMANKIEITLYRIFQELVHNIIKHSGASEVLIQLRKMNTHILLMVEDNGKGITADKKTGIGISNLKSRAQLVDGNFQYESSENEGTTAIVRVPL